MNTEQLIEILCIHNQRYPRWQAQDCIKLLHQAEFGGGHLISNPEENFKRLQTEWNQQPRDLSHLFKEEIGNDFFRIYLPSYKARGGSPKRLQDAFYQSTFLSSGNTEEMKKDLECLLQCGKQGCFPFSWQGLAEEIQQFEALSFPMMRHSETYREHYKPSYRVIHRKCLTLL